MDSKIDMEKITFRNETPEDYKAVENLTREAFWNVYKPGCDEHFVLHSFRTRSDFVPELDIIMEENGVLIGHVMFARAEIKLNNGETLPIMTFGPISIATNFKRKGYGTVLLRHAMEKAKEMDCGALAITGNIGFYGKSGFVVAKTKGVRYHADPDAEYFLINELIPGFLDKLKEAGGGTFKEPDGYFIDSKEAEEFDRQFPPKEKLKLPGQIFD
ncbi:N-acetyltransferase [uncultured Treponema sp.]|uniref:GNAT family N-acetyltransferase n=1 Tax=uncultured Treponema sp. TaxID=162155 RepID=UPI000E899CC1|nr:N-acetyltransferase [uncultured Treponema sp.]HAZ96980.1 GNAT family N-acetyltransferase [Treponema sp.]